MFLNRHVEHRILNSKWWVKFAKAELLGGRLTDVSRYFKFKELFFKVARVLFERVSVFVWSVSFS